MGVLLFLRKVAREILILTVTFLVVPSIILIIILCTPIYMYRYFISIVGKYFRPDLCKILTTRSSIFAVDDLYKRPRAPLLIFMILDGVVDIEGGRDFLQKQLVDAVDSNGQKTRPELCQFVSRWMGFYFWKKDEHFDITNHVKVYDGPLRAVQYNEPLLYRIANELVSKPFIKYRSPWEFIVFPNTVDETGEKQTTAVCLKIHHAIADGFSILKLVGELITSEGRILPLTPNYTPGQGFRRVLEVLAMAIMAPYQLVKTFAAYDFNDWHISEKELSRKVNGAVLEKLSVESIKEIKNMADVTFTAVLLAAFSGGLRNFMLEQKVKVPRKLHCITPLPMVGHPDKMRNFMTLCWVSLPVGISDPIERLRAIDKHLHELKSNTLPIFLFYMIPFIGGVFPFLTQFFARQCSVTALMSNFPGPPDLVYYCGIPVIDMIFTGGMLPGNIGVGLASISYNGYIRIAAGLDEAIVPATVPVRALVDKIAQELDILRKEVSV